MLLRAVLIASLILISLATSVDAQPDARDLDPGVTVRIYSVEADLSAIPALAPDQTPNSDRLVPTIDLAEDAGFDSVPAPLVTTVTGWLLIDEAAAYQFRLTSDDGSRLLIDGRLAIDHDGRHSATAMESRPIEFEPALHALRIDHFDHGGGKRLLLEWRRDDGEYEVVPESSLRAERDLTRVTSPGFKRIEDNRRPGDGRPLDGVHPAWRVETIRPEGFEPMVGAMAFDAKGRLIVGTFNPLQRDEESLPDIESKEPDRLFAVTGYDSASPEVRVVAEGFYEPAGMCNVGDDLYVAHRRAITRLRDLDGDGYFEDRKDVAAGWEGWNYHQFVFGLVHLDGKLYAALSTSMAPPGWEGMGTNAGPNGPMRGGILEVDLSIDDPAHAARIIAGGTRTPNGIGLGPNQTLWYLDNQGTWMPTSQMAQVIPGRFYGHYNRTNLVPNLAGRFPDGGHPSVFADRPRTPAAVLMPQNEVSNSPTQPVLIERGLFAGQMLVGELTAGGIRRAALEKINGQYQGALLRFTQGLECGVNRLAWGSNGALYAGGIGAGGNWNWRKTKYGLQRLVPTGETAFEIHSVSATPSGFEIWFTKEPNWPHLADPARYTIKHWRYEPTVEYGGPKVEQEILPVVGIRTHLERALGDQPIYGVSIRIDGLRDGRCVHIRVDPTSIDGDALWSPEAWYTLNEIPRDQPARVSKIANLSIDPDEAGVGVGVLPPADAVTLIGASADMAFHRSSDRQMPSGAGRSQDDLMALPGDVKVGKGSGDLISSTLFGDCRLHLEWLSPPGGLGQLAGNSGVYLQNLYEIQVLGTKSLAQGGPEQPELNEAGAIYNIRRPDVNASNGPGQWQAYDIWFRAPRFENGAKTEDARVTVYFNGRLIHDDVAIPHPTGGRSSGGEPGPEGGTGVQTGPLLLQDHASRAEGAVRYRNIWIAPLDRPEQRPGEWIDLLEGERWLVRGGEASIEIEGGEVVGRSRPNTPNTFLVSKRTFADFELLLEVKVDDELNSGVQIRSEVAGGLDSRSGPLRGYQVEIDPSDRAYTAGLYDERRRGWLHPLVDAPYARRAFRHGDWNRLRILAEGPVIRTWINGVPAAEVFDAMTDRGHIALQVHGVGDREDELQVRFRNLRLRELRPVQ